MRKNALLGLALASLCAAAPAGAIDLTGSWTGSVTCKRFTMNGESVTQKTKPATLSIVQAGALFDAAIDGLEYRGRTIDLATDGLKRGEAVLVSCDADAIPLEDGVTEIVRFKAKVDAEKGTGTLTGEALHEHGMNGIMSCKLKFKRTSAIPGAFSTCDEL
jgi:hypothetical protein